ncbi:hypothetical protein [Bacillus thuringiensis]|uniref:hypothetical protein n=1 Tax=Bacillus thuringiensis TaxID=1428 RepID=UPI0021D662A9|nr:hypothetical protein [Bacillus thuringiensis]MCU7667094.1 hypothetical protein [Bacillus thuringiensis]
MNVLKKIGCITLSASLLFPNLVLADDIYKVTGNSMYPTLKEGQYVKKVSDTYRIGDTVVAKDKKTKEMVVKRVKGQKLIGDNKTTRIYDMKDMDVKGKVEPMNAINNTNVIEVKASEGPLIKKAYAGDSTVVFLNNDTSLSGFGKNILGVLGKSNTTTLTKISNPTGYEKLKVSLGNNRRDDYFLGFKPDASGGGWYDVYLINNQVKHPLQENKVKDYSLSFPFEYIYVRVEPDGNVRTKGSEMHGYMLGHGTGHPFDKGLTRGGYQDIVDVQGKGEIVEASGDGFEHLDKNQPANFVTPEFTITPENPNFNIRAYSMKPLDGWDNSTLTIELLKAENNSVVYTFNKPWNRNHEYYTDNGAYGFINMPGKYKMRVTSKDISYKLQVDTRHDFPYKGVATAALATEQGTWTLMTEENDLYIMRLGYGLVRKVNKPDNLKLKPETLVWGNTQYHVIDEFGRVWKWNTENNFSMVPFPVVNGKPFYDEHEVLEASDGLTSSIYLVRNKVTNETFAYAYGTGDFGELGLEGTKSVSVATVVTRNGQPLTNIQSVAAGRNFSVVVQNTSEGQLVWTAGKNESGQLGGGVNLKVPEPAIVPGLNNIKLVQGYRGENTEHRFAYNSLVMSDDKMYGFGKSFSYPQEVSLGSMPYISEVKQSFSVMTFLSRDEKIPYIAGNTWRGRRAGTVNNFDKIPADVNFRKTYNEGQTYFSNVRALQVAKDGGSLIDKNGLIWSWGIHYNAGQGTHMRSDGANQWTDNAKPALLDGNDPNSIGPAKFVQLGGYGDITQGLDSNNKLWYVTDHLFPISSSAAINGVNVKKLYGGVVSGAIVDDLGRLWAYGDNAYGNLGVGNTSAVSYDDPKLVNPSYYNNEKVVSVTMLLKHTLFVTESGSVYAMGDNSYGQLGNGTFNNSTIPVKVMNVKDAVMVGGGDMHSLVLDKQGRVWSFGYTGDGSLGNNFSLTREKFSTAVGNDLPEMSISNDIKDYYLSKNGNQAFNLHGTIREKEGETTKIKTTILGIDKQMKVDASEWELDVYDQVKPKEWNAEVNVNDVGNEQAFQSLIKVAAEDERGGLVEQFFAGRIIVDNEKPVTPTWGNTCVVSNNGTENCFESNYFKQDGTNGVNNAVRLYLKPIQKTGNNKAPVKVQIQYRIKQPYGYAPAWSNWIDVETKNQDGYYYDFFQGFYGETQVKLRAIDEAGNVSDANSEYRYVIINNAGAEVKTISAKFGELENKLFNEISFTGNTPSGSAIKSYGVNRRLTGESSWTNLTSTRVSWNGLADATFKDESPELLGNAKYEYKVDIENSVTIGKGKTTNIITYPYYPLNIIRKVNQNGIDFNITQDERNRGEILYRLVLVDNQTGKVYFKDTTSSNSEEEAVIQIKEGEVPFSILNNSIMIKLLIKGENNEFITIIYDENFENTPSIATDKKPPEVIVGIEGNPEMLVYTGSDNQVNLNFSATDNVTPNNKLKVQFSADGANWYGQKFNGIWEKNFWSNYKDLYTNFNLGSYVGNKIIYVRVKDEAGNIGAGNTSILISNLVNRDGNSYITDETRGRNSGDGNGPIYVNNSYVKLKIPKTGNVKEAQYSFDGVEWSPWEVVKDNHTKLISLPPKEGKHSIMLRYKNEFGNITRVQNKNDIIKYILDRKKPELEATTSNGTYIVKETGAAVVLNVNDNLSSKITVKLLTTEYQMFNGSLQTTSIEFKNGERKTMFISGLKNGFNVITFEIIDEAGNTNLKTVRLFKKY